jgi:hypothetical protein
MRSIVLTTAALSVIETSAFGQGVDPIIGTWKLNVEKSTYIGVPLTTLTFAGEVKISTTPPKV